ncbi:hypothetical protein GGF46_005397 [Coemansia sp. RSA 552]|nr:hypothetical protein GGF46_005397 [Coemansia sp. RSA 552]
MDKDYGKMAKKPSVPLGPGRVQTEAEKRAASLPPESMYRYALRTNHGLAKQGPPSVASSAGRQSDTGSTKMGPKEGIWLNVKYVHGGSRKRITFPPGMTVAQARDLCMLRFGVWQEIMMRERSAEASGSTGLADSQSTKTQSTASSAGNDELREQYGLYMPAREQWLDTQDLLSMYSLVPGEKAELQDRQAFVATAATVGTPSTTRGAETDSSLDVERVVEGEGLIYYLQTKGMSTAWKQCWLELQGTSLACYKRKRLGTMLGITRSMREAPLVLVDLSGGFKLVDQHGRQNQRVSTSDQLATTSFVGLASYQHLGGNGAPLIIKCSDGRVHVFCTHDAVDYDYWRRMLRRVQTEHELPTSISSSSSSGGGSSGGNRKRRGSSIHPLPPPASSQSIATSSLVHRPRPQDGRPLPHVVLRPKREPRFADMVSVRRGTSGPQPRIFCVIIRHELFGFGSEYSGPWDAPRMHDEASFCVELRGARVHRVSEQRGSEMAFVICIQKPDDDAVLLDFDVDSLEHSDRWADALRCIGEVAEIAEIADDPPPSASVRRSRSFVSTVSRANWPTPPTSLPYAHFPDPPTDPAARPRGMSISGDSLSPAIGGGANPSLDAVGMRFDPGAGRSPRQSPSHTSRFPWLRRGMFRPSTDSSD